MKRPSEKPRKRILKNDACIVVSIALLVVAGINVVLKSQEDPKKIEGDRKEKERVFQEGVSKKSRQRVREIIRKRSQNVLIDVLEEGHFVISLGEDLQIRTVDRPFSDRDEVLELFTQKRQLLEERYEMHVPNDTDSQFVKDYFSVSLEDRLTELDQRMQNSISKSQQLLLKNEDGEWEVFGKSLFETAYEVDYDEVLQKQNNPYFIESLRRMALTMKEWEKFDEKDQGGYSDPAQRAPQLIETFQALYETGIQVPDSYNFGANMYPEFVSFKEMESILNTGSQELVDENIVLFERVWRMNDLLPSELVPRELIDFVESNEDLYTERVFKGE